LKGGEPGLIDLGGFKKEISKKKVGKGYGKCEEGASEQGGKESTLKKQNLGKCNKKKKDDRIRPSKEEN